MLLFIELLTAEQRIINGFQRCTFDNEITNFSSSVNVDFLYTTHQFTSFIFCLATKYGKNVVTSPFYASSYVPDLFTY